MSNLAESKKRALKEIIRQLLDGVPPQEVKVKFKNVLEGTTSEDIAKIEQKLVKEGILYCCARLGCLPLKPSAG